MIDFESYLKKHQVPLTSTGGHRIYSLTNLGNFLLFRCNLRFQLSNSPTFRIKICLEMYLEQKTLISLHKKFFFNETCSFKRFSIIRHIPILKSTYRFISSFCFLKWESNEELHGVDSVVVVDKPL